MVVMIARPVTKLKLITKSTNIELIFSTNEDTHLEAQKIYEILFAELL
jgi:hypothetical protein